MTQLHAPDRPATRRRLSDLGEEERYQSFDDLQLAMPAVGFHAVRPGRRIRRRGPLDQHRAHHPRQWHRHASAGGTRAVPAPAAAPATAAHDLRDVATDSESIIQYYLGLLPGVIPSHARARLTVVPVGDASSDPLSAKLFRDHDFCVRSGKWSRTRTAVT